MKEKILEIIKEEISCINNFGFGQTQFELDLASRVNVLFNETINNMSKQPACEHNYQIARKDYYKPTGQIGALGLMTYKQDKTYSMLYCTKCADTKEIISSY